MESDEDSDSPDSIVPASSPESILGEEAPRFPQLGSGRWEQDDRALSPVIPIIPRASIPGMCNSGNGPGPGWLGCQNRAGVRGGGKQLNLQKSLFLIQSSQIPNLMGPLTWRSLESCLPHLGRRAKEVRCQLC
jgi:hypothetical protein